MPSPQSQGIMPPIVEPISIPIQIDKRMGAKSGQLRRPVYEVNS